MQVPVGLRKVGEVLIEKSPVILTGLAVGGVVTTGIFAGKASIKAYKILEEKKAKDPEAELKLKDKALLVWKPYIPVAISGVATVACIICASTVQQKRHAALMSLYSITEAGFREYKDKVAEIIGDKKAQEVHDEVMTDVMARTPLIEQNILSTGHGKSLCFDSMSGRYFYSDIEKIRRIVNDLNHDLMGVMWVPLNDLYYALGLPGIKLGDDIGWTVDELIDMKFTSTLTDDGEPALVIDYDLTPRFLKGNLWSGM